MELENKQRIVGIIVLIAFIALLVPFLFTSGVKKKQQLVSSDEPTPIQISDLNPSSSTDKQLLPDSKHQPITLPLELQENISEKIDPDDSQQPIVSSKEPNIKEIPLSETILSQNIVDNIEIAEPTIVTKTEPVIVNSAKNKPNSVKNKKVKNYANISPKFWSVQVGSFSDQLRTQKMVASLQSKGFHVYLQKINTYRGPMVRVLVGHEINKDKATKIAQQLKTKLKIDGHIIGNKK